MAGFRKRGKTWVARVRPTINGKRKEIPINLRTGSKVTAGQRLAEIKKKEDEIIELYKNGENYCFPWLNSDGVLKIEYLTFEDAITKWLTLRKSQGIAESTISRNINSMNTMMSIWGKNIRLSDITLDYIDTYTEEMSEREYKPQGINLNLRTFLNWAYRREYIKKVPYIQLVKVDKPLPSYVPDRYFSEIMELDCLDVHYKKAFQFYRDTGCRLSEPFVGELIGNVLVIPAEYSKSRMEKEIKIGMDHIPILFELQERYHSWKKKVKKPLLKYFKDKYSKEFKRCCRLVGIDRRFHDLRHTFAVRRYLMTRDIYQVMKEMGHSKVTTTQIYTEFRMSRLASDFPNLIHEGEKEPELMNGDNKMGYKPTVYLS